MKGAEVTCSGCQSTDRELRRRKIAGGSIQYVYQCLNCGRASSNPLPRASIDRPDALPDWDESITSRADELRQIERAEDRAAWFVEHNRYLRTPEWRARRTAVMARAKGTCEGCAQCAATQVHHLTYEHWQHELLWELVAVCDECHERAHDDNQVRPGMYRGP